MNIKRKRLGQQRKLEFEGENVAFIFQARNPLTRHAKKLKEGSKEVQETFEIVKDPEEVVDLSSLGCPLYLKQLFFPLILFLGFLSFSEFPSCWPLVFVLPI